MAIPEVTLKGVLEQSLSIAGELETDITLEGSIDSLNRNVIREDYNDLVNKPRINSVLLKGDKTLEELGTIPSANKITNQQIYDILNS